MPWSTAFEDPIPVATGRALLTLKDAGRYIQKLPKAEQHHEAWQTATLILIAAAEGRDFVMHARIAVLRALHRDRLAPAPGPRRKPAKTYRIGSDRIGSARFT